VQREKQRYPGAHRRTQRTLAQARERQKIWAGVMFGYTMLAMICNMISSFLKRFRGAEIILQLLAIERCQHLS